MEIIEIIKTIILGIIQGITEWLPISSTGHMILANEFLKLNVSESFWELFFISVSLIPSLQLTERTTLKKTPMQVFLKNSGLFLSRRQFLFGLR